MQSYQEFEHTADIGVEIFGDTLKTLFQNAGFALFDIMLDITTIQPVIQRTVDVSGNDAETLLMNWLRELLYLSTVEQEVYAEFEIQSFCPTALQACVKGESLNLERHRVHTEIKAVTYHQFSVAQEHGSWKARVIFDV